MDKQELMRLENEYVRARNFTLVMDYELTRDQQRLEDTKRRYKDALRRHGLAYDDYRAAKAAYGDGGA